MQTKKFCLGTGYHPPLKHAPTSLVPRVDLPNGKEEVVRGEREKEEGKGREGGRKYVEK